MNQITRTSIFLGVAAASVGLAVLVGFANRPGDNLGGYEVGTPFFPEFDDPLAATALQVAAFDEEAGSVNVFRVEKKNGIWQIPSHHNYPADGEERLAKTATSMLRVERGALVSTSAQDHKRYRVLDPLDEAPSGTEGYGDRITLLENDSKLLDLIIGDQVEDQQDVYYVRRPDESQIYRARLGTIDLSARFADWIEQDLLELNSSSDLVEMVVHPYHFDEIRGVPVPDEELIVLERKPATSPWKLEGLDGATEKEKLSVINAMSRALADLEIVGVRRKPESLISYFRGEGDARLTGSDVRQMAQAGFFIFEGALMANEGEIQAGTGEGVRYRLQFGEVFTGSDVQIEVGTPVEAADEGAVEDAADEGTEGSESADDDAAEEGMEEEEEDQETDSSTQRSRYLFVSVLFDEGLLGERPEPPVPPTPPGEEAAPVSESPEGDAPAGDAANEAAEENSTGETAPAAEGEDSGAVDAAAEPDAGAESATDDATPGPDDAESDAAETPAGDATEGDAPAAGDDPADAPDTPTPQETYEREQAAYELAREEYESALAEFEEKVAAGNERVQELNRRFAEWYYVISADLYEDLKVRRADLVEPAEPPADSDTTGGPDLESLLQGLNPDAPPADPGAPENDPAPLDAPAGDSAPESTEPSADPEPEAETADPAADSPADESPGGTAEDSAGGDSEAPESP